MLAKIQYSHIVSPIRSLSVQEKTELAKGRTVQVTVNVQKQRDLIHDSKIVYSSDTNPYSSIVRKEPCSASARKQVFHRRSSTVLTS